MSASVDALEFHTTHRCHSVFSCLAPDASFHERLVASEKVATRLPPVVERTSGSFPRFPISVTLFKLRLTNSSWREVLGSRRARCHPTDVAVQSITCASNHSAPRGTNHCISATSASTFRLSINHWLCDDALQHDGVFHRPAIVRFRSE